MAVARWRLARPVPARLRGAHPPRSPSSPPGQGIPLSRAAPYIEFPLEKLAIADPLSAPGAGAFVDNYPSFFGVAYGGSPNLARVVDVALNPGQLYSVTDPGDKHSYAAAWYGGAAASARSLNLTPLGLAWPPPPNAYLPALDQLWPGGATPRGQWTLQAGSSLLGPYAYSTVQLAVDTLSVIGNVTGSPDTVLFFPPSSTSAPWAVFQGGYRNNPLSDGYGLAFDVVWLSPQPGDYLVVTAESPDERRREVLLVMDGRSAFRGLFPVAFNADVSSLLEQLQLFIYYTATSNNSGGVQVSNFRSIEVRFGTLAMP